MGRDGDGDPITAPVALELEEAPAKLDVSATEAKALDELKHLAKDFVAVQKMAWLARLQEPGVASTADKPDSRRRAAARLVRGLIDRGIVVEEPDGTVSIAGTDKPGHAGCCR